MRTHSYLFAFFALLLVGGAFGLLIFDATRTKEPVTSLEIETPQPSAISPTPVPAPKAPGTTMPTNSMIRVDLPLPGSKITSPLEIKGSARGLWYFEASFPVRLEDENGNVLVVTPAQAQGEWMTEDFVPFSVMLSWASTTATRGVLVLERDNPSGLPEHAAEIRIPVVF